MLKAVVKLYKRATIYYKLAQQLNLPFHEDFFQSKPTQKESEYHKWVSMLPTLSLTQKLLNADYFWGEPYFNYKMIIDAIMEHIFGIDKQIGFAMFTLDGEKIDAWKKKRLKTEAIKYYLDHRDMELGVNDYIKYVEGDNDLPNEYLRKAQSQLVKWIKENAEDYFDTCVKVVLKLLKESKKFNKDFILLLAKHLGPEFYAEVASDYYPYKEKESYNYLPSERRETQILNKESLNIYDVAEWLKIQHKKYFLLNKEQFEQVIGKSDIDAKNYLRRFLYRSDDGTHFILSEDMTPMNKDYGSMPFPKRFQIFRDWQSVDPLRKVWAPIFEEFQIIPVVYNYED